MVSRWERAGCKKCMFVLLCENVATEEDIEVLYWRRTSAQDFSIFQKGTGAIHLE